MHIEDAIDELHSQLLSLQKDLGNDDIALSWFDLSQTSDLSNVPSTPLAAAPNLIKDVFQGW
jgi:hypothetical protein